MPDSLAALEDCRSRLLLELAQLGDFRRGSIQSLFRRCGKPNCACAQAGHPGHGPVTRLAYKETVNSSAGSLGWLEGAPSNEATSSVAVGMRGCPRCISPHRNKDCSMSHQRRRHRRTVPPRRLGSS